MKLYQAGTERGLSCPIKSDLVKLLLTSAPKLPKPRANILKPTNNHTNHPISYTQNKVIPTQTNQQMSTISTRPKQSHHIRHQMSPN